MAKALQPYASFAIENNAVTIYREEIFPIDSMLTDKGQELATVVRNVNAFYYLNSMIFVNKNFSDK